MTDAWKESARAWWERMREAEKWRDGARQAAREAHQCIARLKRRLSEAEAERDEWKRAVKHVDADNRRLIEERDELLQKLEGREAVHHHHYEMRKRIEDERDVLRLELDKMTATCDGVLAQLKRHRAQPSENPGEFADLAERIAKADAKHPRDARDMEERDVEPVLSYSRARLRDAPTWENALRCELDEALAEFWRGDAVAAADELLDVAVVALRWRRAVLERGKK